MRRYSSGLVPVGHTAYQPGTPLLSSKTPDPMAQGPGSPPGYWRPGSQAVHESGRLPDQVIQVYPQAAQHGQLSAQSPPLVQGSPGAPVQFELQPGVSHQAAALLQPSLMGDAGSPPIAALDRHSAHGPIATAGIDPGQLAELVNQALVEQARRYGVDIS